jgi:hypothetical protein
MFTIYYKQKHTIINIRVSGGYYGKYKVVKYYFTAYKLFTINDQINTGDVSEIFFI